MGLDVKPATTTAQQNLTLSSQRKVNLIWEYTQAVIAVVLIGAFVAVVVEIVFLGATKEVPAVLAAITGTVVGSYFQRTNHMNIGGIGPKRTDGQEYEGR
jgi:uncharacterized integral membrane protein